MLTEQLSEVDKLCANGKYISALEFLLKLDNDTEAIEKIQDLLEKPEIGCVLTPGFVDILIEEGYDIGISKTSTTKKAIFPTIEPSGNHSLLEAEWVKSSEYRMDESISEKSVFTSAMYNFFNRINTILTCAESSTKKVYILNFGGALKISPVNNKRTIKHTSYCFAAFAAYMANLFDLPLNNNYAFSGSIDENLQVAKVNNLAEKFKLIKKERPNTTKFFVPHSKFYKDEPDTVNLLNEHKIFVQIDSIETLIAYTFGKKIEEVCCIPEEKLILLGYARMQFSYFNDLKLDISEPKSERSERRTFKRVLFVDFKNDSGKFDIFPPKPEPELTGIDLMIWNGMIVNIYTAYLLTNHWRTLNIAYAIRKGQADKYVFCAERSIGTVLLGREFDMPVDAVKTSY